MCTLGIFQILWLDKHSIAQYSGEINTQRTIKILHFKANKKAVVS